MGAFLDAYYYNISNGGGDNMVYAAHDKLYDYNLEQVNELSSSFYTANEKDKDGKMKGFVIGWAPNTGLEIENKYILSPATILEHEFDHAVSDITNSSAHFERKKTKSKNFKNREEERVIKGSETKTAKANGEIPISREFSRFSYGNDTNFVPVRSSRSNKKTETKSTRNNNNNRIRNEYDCG